MTITCPKCKTEFPLTERALAGQIEGEVAKRVAAQRKRLADEAAHDAQIAAAAAIEEKDRTLKALRTSVGDYRDKLAAAQADQLELERSRNALAQKLSEADLEVEQRVRGRVDGETLRMKERIKEQYELQVHDRDLKLGQARTQIEDLQRRLAQGSQQLQGESQEISIEQELRAAFPTDTFTPIAKGECGADLLQTVVAPGGQVCGTILWESKRTKNWNAAWLEKLRADQRESKADVSVLVSQAVPADVTSFKNVDDVWVTRRPLIVPIASMLRSALVRVAFVRATSQGRQTKADMVYDYLMGADFRHRVMPVLESLAYMRTDLNAKRARIERELAKEEQRITIAQVSVQRLLGDIQGIAGITIEELDELPMPALVAAG
ncbi:MAG TPA: DUF2130 domain-containing protein [Candidatus Baltobacteraceae bacterium]|jgi:hypothetical protein